MTLFGAAIVLVNHLNVSTHLHSPAYNEVFAYTRLCLGAPSKYSYTSICMLHTHKHTFSTHTSIAGIAKCANWLTVELLINRITLWLVSYGVALARILPSSGIFTANSSCCCVLIDAKIIANPCVYKSVYVCADAYVWITKFPWKAIQFAWIISVSVLGNQ